MTTIDLARLGLRPGANTAPLPRPQRQRAPRHRADARFLRGPIPWDWLVRAARLPGHALHVGVALWHLSGLHRQAAQVVLPTAVLRELGIKRTTAYRALTALEDAALIVVERHAGRLPRVTLLAAEEAP
jgi:DNA-binding MarR family transcriptional regulator